MQRKEPKTFYAYARVIKNLKKTQTRLEHMGVGDETLDLINDIVDMVEDKANSLNPDDFRAYRRNQDLVII